MRGFDIQLNGQKLHCVGVGDEAVLNANVNIVPRSGRDHDIHIRVGGMENDEFISWGVTRLTLGDEITIRIIEAPVTDPPSQRIPKVEFKRSGGEL